MRLPAMPPLPMPSFSRDEDEAKEACLPARSPARPAPACSAQAAQSKTKSAMPLPKACLPACLPAQSACRERERRHAEEEMREARSREREEESLSPAKCARPRANFKAFLFLFFPSCLFSSSSFPCRLPQCNKMCSFE